MDLSPNKAVAYALHVLCYIDHSGDGRPVIVSEICERYDLPYDSTLKVLQQLSRRGIVRAHRGSHGGFSLRGPANTITLLEVIETLDGYQTCENPLPPSVGDNHIMSELLISYQLVHEKLRDEFGKRTIADLTHESRLHDLSSEQTPR